MKLRRRSLNLPDVKTVRCSCGHLAAGETSAELLAAVEAHIDAEHASHEKRTHRAPSAAIASAARAWGGAAMKLTRTLSVRLAGLIVLAMCVTLPVGGAVAHAASEHPSLDWSMPDRYGDANQDGLGDQVYPPDGQAQIDPGGWRVDLTVSGADCGGSTQRTWWIEGTRVVSGDPRLLAGSAGGCSLSYRFPAEGVYEVAFEERDQHGNLLGSAKRAITVQDFLIVSIGDSVASGEGNPEVPGALSASWENGSAAAGQCHRSRWAGPAQGALALEQADPHSSVTFVHLACSGATILNGLLGPELPGQGPVTVQQPTQLDQLKQLVGNREIDALFVSIGANDAHFSQLVKDCKLKANCNDATIPGSAAQNFAREATKLPGRYDQLASALDGLGIASERVYLTEYFDPTHDGVGAICDGSILGDAPFPGSITGTEAQWASTSLVGGLNAIGTAAASAHSWHRVGGIASQFLTHGYCAADHWVVRFLESLATQGDINGTIHPNRSGQGVYGKALDNATENDLYPDGGQLPRRPFQRLVLQGEGPADSSFGDVVGDVQPGATVQLRVQLDGKDTAFRNLTYSVQGQGRLSAASGTTDSTGVASLTYTAPDTPTGCTDGPVCGVITAAFTDQDGLHTDTLTVGVDEPVKVTVSPSTVTLAPGQKTTFGATVDGTPDQSVTWTGAGGTIDQNGNYTAGGTPGTYTVTATSAADPTASGTATVTITGAASGVWHTSTGANLEVSASAGADDGGSGDCGNHFPASPTPTSWSLSSSCAASDTDTSVDPPLAAQANGSGTISFQETYAANGDLIGVTASGSGSALASASAPQFPAGSLARGTYQLGFSVPQPVQVTIHASAAGGGSFDIGNALGCRPLTGSTVVISWEGTSIDRTIQLPVGTCTLIASFAAIVAAPGGYDVPSDSFDFTVSFAPA